MLSKGIRFGFVLFCALGLALTSAHAGSGPDDPVDPFKTKKTKKIQIGTGVTSGMNTASRSDGVLELILSVKASWIKPGKGDTVWVIVRASGDISANNNPQQYDFEISAVGYGQVTERSYMVASLFNVAAQRDLFLGMERSARISFLGLRSGMRHPISSDGLSFVADLAIDLLGTGMMERSSDGTRVDGSAYGIGAEMGIQAGERFRLVIGGRVNGISTDPGFEGNGTIVCDGGTFVNPGSEPYTWQPTDYCDQQTGYGCGGYCFEAGRTTSKTAQLSEFYGKMSGRIADRLGWMVKGGVAVFRMNDDYGDFEDSRNSGARLKFGIFYSL